MKEKKISLKCHTRLSFLEKQGPRGQGFNSGAAKGEVSKGGGGYWCERPNNVLVWHTVVHW